MKKGFCIVLMLLTAFFVGCNMGENSLPQGQPENTPAITPEAAVSSTPSPTAIPTVTPTVTSTAIPTVTLTATPTATPIVLSAQWKEAVTEGIAWEALVGRAEENLSAAEAVRLVENAVKAMKKETELSYLIKFSDSHSQAEMINRIQLAELLWCTYVDVVHGDGQYFHEPHFLWERINGSAINYKPGEYYEGVSMAVDEEEIFASAEDGWRVVNYVIGAYDRTNGEKLMPLYEDGTFRPKDMVTVEEAVRIFLRFSRSIEPEARYVSVTEAGTHTINPALYTGETRLPDACNENLPEWKGFNISFEGMLLPGALSGNPDDNAYRAEIAYIKELGANYAHIYLSWSWFQGPDYTCDNRVNLCRLERLDEIISWCMEEEIHLQLVFNDIPNLNGSAEMDLNDWFEDSNLVFTDVEVRDNVTEFWRMLARRYADIPNNYLSFNLMNECDPLNDENYAWAFKNAVEAIWEESPGRVVVADVHSGNITGESMAALGCALSFHLYNPNMIAVIDPQPEEVNPGFYERLQWPALLTASTIYGPGAEWQYPELAARPMTISGNVGTAQLELRFRDISWGYEVVEIKADEKTLYQGIPEFEYIPEEDRNKPTSPLCVTIPEGTKQITIACTEGYAFSMGGCSLTYPDGAFVELTPLFDWWGGMEYVDVHVGEDYTCSGSVNGTEVKGYDFANSKYGLVTLNELIAIGDKYNVDVMIGECGIFENGSSFSFGMTHETASAFIGEEIELFESLGLAWTCELYGRYTILTPAPYLAGIEYEKAEGMPYYANQSMEAFFREKLK